MMTNINAFLYVLKNTFFSPSYYKDILKVPFSFSFKFFIFYFFFYAVIGTVLFYVQSGPFLNRTFENLPQKVLQLYPDDLVIKVQDGKVSTNVQEPYIITADQFENAFKEDVLGINEKDDIKNVLVIDTKADADDIEKYKTAVLLTETSIVTVDNQSGYRIYPLADAENFTLNEKMVSTMLMAIKPYLKWIAPFIVIAVFLALFVFAPAFTMLYIFFLALVLFILSKVMNVQISYWKNYQIGLHLTVISTTVFGILSIGGLHPNFPFLQTIFLTLYAFFAFQEIKRESKPAPAPKAK